MALELSLNGSDKGLSQQEQFVRSGSSRSAASWHGFRLGQHNAPARSSSHSGRSHRLGSLVGRETSHIKSSSTSAVTKASLDVTHRNSNENSLNGTSIKSAEGEGQSFNDSGVTPGLGTANGHKHKDSSNDSVRPHAIEKTRDTLQTSVSMSSLSGSEKKVKKSSSSGFFSKSEKHKKEKSKKPPKKEKSKSKKEKSKQRGSRSSDEKLSSGKLRESLDSSKNSMSDLSNSSKTSLKKTTSVSDIKRRDSISSVNSVQSCVVPSTVYSTDSNALSNSRTSLDSIKKTSSTSTPLHTDSLPHSSAGKKTIQSYIVQSSVCPRTRPKVKHSERITEAESNPHNPPMFKAHPSTQNESTFSENSSTVNASTNFDHNETERSPEKRGWTASFDTEFADFKSVESAENLDKDSDPFSDLKMNSSDASPKGSAAFDDAAWGTAPVEDQAPDPGGNIFSKSSFDPFTESNDASFQSNPFVVDPFRDIQMEDPLTDPFAPFDEEEFFGDTGETQAEVGHSSPDPERTLTYSPGVESDSDNGQSVNSKHNDSDQCPKPTFPSGMESLPSRLENFKHETSADSSSLTSGMSTPVASSPVPTNHTSPAKDIPSLPPPLPPRIPPRSKTNTQSPPNEEGDAPPQVPPPPLPTMDPDFSFSENEGEMDSLGSDPPDYMPPELPEVIGSGPNSPVENQKVPPAIPERTHSRESSFSSGVTSRSALQANPPNTAPQKNSSYSDELFALDAPAAQPAPQPGAKLTKDQILMGYGGAPHPGMVPGPQQMMPPGAQMPGQYGVQPQMTQGFPQQVGGFGQPAASAPYGMFPTGPSPAIPPRPGAMRPPVQQLAPGGAPQNPFGDAASVGVNSGGLLAPSNSMPAAAGGGDTTASTGKSAPSDPFANLIPGMGGSSTTSKKDMFKNFEMAKPPQPPPRTNVPPSNGTASIPNQDQAPMSDFDNYFIKNVGGIPIAEKEAPVATPRSNNAEANDPFGISLDQGPTTNQAVDDPFASRGAFTEPFQFNQTTDNSQSLFGI